MNPELPKDDLHALGHEVNIWDWYYAHALEIVLHNFHDFSLHPEAMGRMKHLTQHVAAALADMAMEARNKRLDK